MNQNRFFKIFAFIAFLLLMGISCWATVESLHLLLPRWPIVIFWSAAIIFFVVAAIGTKLIVDSFNQRIRVDNRGWKLIGGIILLLAFWLCFSLPTSTHTFFYRSEITPILIDELERTKGKLELLQNGNKAIEMIKQEEMLFRNKVNNAFTKVQEEVMDKNNIGFGDRAKRALLDLQAILGDGVKFQEPKFVNTEQGRRNCVDNLQNQKDNFLEEKCLVYKERIAAVDKKLKEKNITKNINAIKAIQQYIQEHPNSHKEPTQATVDVLVNSFSIISDLSDYLVDKNDEKGRNQLQTEFKLPKTRRMLSVIDVWKDFLTTNNFDGRGFAFWVMLAALIDIAGFIFFSIAFRKEI
ncbi:MAG: hypothetical protein FWC41_03395 [Firmicutes bacterium]|nr:hypothetical protein [Bacillota bacterium]